MTDIVYTSILSMAGLGLFFALVLAVVNQKLKVKEDPMVKRIENTLPRLNCGACGFASCRLYAEALVRGRALPDQCKAGGDEVLTSLSDILGVKVEKKVKELAIVHCGADISKRKKKASYVGIKTCIAAHNTSGGEILCEYGCFGYGDCMRACPFGAITMVNGLPKIDKDRCTACGKCVIACPRDLITVEELSAKDFIYVACNNQDKRPETIKTCPVGCIACGLCQKLTGGIFHVEENLAWVQYDKMKNVTDPEQVVKKCPTKCILKVP